MNMIKIVKILNIKNVHAKNKYVGNFLTILGFYNYISGIHQKNQEHECLHTK